MGRAVPTVLSGRVTSTDNGCVVFKNDRDAHRWVLIGGPESLTAGTAYVIQGVAMDVMDPACPQGLPFQVSDATEAQRDDQPIPLPTTSTKGQPVTLTGTVASGVEAGCRVLRTEDGTFVLVGEVAVADGTRVTVRGTRSADRRSHCMQGPVVEVSSLAPVR
jgi:hypothetical protein